MPLTTTPAAPTTPATCSPDEEKDGVATGFDIAERQGDGVEGQALAPSPWHQERMRQAAAACVHTALADGADAVAWTRQIYAKPTDGVMGPLARSGGGMTVRGVEMAWCWETGKYEVASEAAEIGATAYAARKAKENEAKEKAEWEAKKAAMSKRDRKKAEKAEEAAAAAAAEAAAIAAEEAEKAAAEAEAAEKARLADPAVQREMRYEAQLEQSVRAVLEASLEQFLQRAVQLDSEPA